MTDAKYGSIYKRGDTVFDKDIVDSKGNPTRKKLWVWDADFELIHGILVALKDGPGEDANDMGWFTEKSLEPWSE